MKRPVAIVDVSILLWEKMARQLVSIIGEGGFQSLYDRSLYLTAPTFPCLTSCNSSTSKSSRFVKLRICLTDQDLMNSGEASIAFLVTFVDILALLIGEFLTSTILDLAWADHALDTVVKEIP